MESLVSTNATTEVGVEVQKFAKCVEGILVWRIQVKLILLKVKLGNILWIIHFFHNVENSPANSNAPTCVDSSMEEGQDESSSKRGFAGHSLHVGCQMSFFLVFRSASLWFVIGHHG